MGIYKPYIHPLFRTIHFPKEKSINYIVLHPPLRPPFYITGRYKHFEQSSRVRIGNATTSGVTQELFATPLNLLPYMYDTAQLKFGGKRHLTIMYSEGIG